MAEKLSVQIALEGGAEIERQLADIGKAGTKAFADISKSAEAAGGFNKLDPKDVTAKLQAMGVTGADSINKIQQAVQAAGRLETLVQGITTVETALKALAIAAIPVGAAIVAGMVAATKMTIAFAESINKVSDEAIKLGMGVQQVDQLRGSLEAAGISGKGVSEILQGMGKAADAAALGNVTQAIKELQEASLRGFGAQGTEQLRTLEQAARGVGPAADAARKALVELGLVRVDPQGVAIIEGLPKTLAQLIGSTGNAAAGLAAFIEQLRQMPPGAQQSALAVQTFGAAAGELVRALNTGQITADQFKQKIEGLISPEAAAKSAALEGAINRLQSAWDRFGSVTFAPLITSQINTVTVAIQNLQILIDNFSWGSFMRAAEAAGSALGWLTPAGLTAKALGAMFGQATPVIQQTGQAIQQTGQAGAQAGQQISQGMNQAGQSLQLVRNPFTGMAEVIRQTGQAGQQAGQQVSQGMNAAAQSTAQAGQAAVQAGQTAQQGAQGFDQIATAVKQTAQAIQQISSALASIDWETIAKAAGPAWEAIVAAVTPAATAVSTFASTLTGIAWEAFSGRGVAAWNAITAAIMQAVSALQQFNALQGAGGGGGGAGGLAHGGLMGGRGTGTSDSNLVWLSRGEHVMPASAVRQPGMLAFLEALRRSGGNLSRVMDRMGHFALGGLVPGPMAIPAFASGGLTGGNNVTIQFPGLAPISGLRASSAVVDELRHAAALAQVRSGGRKPSRYS